MTAVEARSRERVPIAEASDLNLSLADPGSSWTDHRTTAYSVVVPMLNEETTVREFGRRLRQVMDELDGPCEVILVDDGSTDRTYQMMLDLRALDSRFKVLSLSRNFGHQLAITAGLDLAAGDVVVIMDGDLQHPPELLHEFIRLWREGYDVVYGVMREREGQSWPKRFSAGGFYRVIRRLTRVKAPPGAGDFRLVNRKALDAFRSLREEHRFNRGMWDWIGFRQIGIPYVPAKRHAGRSKYTFAKMTRLGLDGIFSFSSMPLRAALVLGVCFGLASLAFGVSAIAARVLDPHLVPGWASLALITSFGLSIQLIVLGVLGEYVGRIYDEVKDRPIYIARARHGFAGSGDGHTTIADEGSVISRPGPAATEHQS